MDSHTMVLGTSLAHWLRERQAMGGESAANAEAKPAATSTAGCLYVAVDRKSVSRSGVASGTWSWPCDSGVQPAARALRRG